MFAPPPIRSLRLVAVTVFPLLVMACGVAPPSEPPASPAPAASSTEPEASAPSEEVTARADPDGSPAEPPPLMPFGVPECDNFITKYVACVDLRVPADQRARLMDDLHEHRAKWRELAKMEQGKLAVGLSCRGVSQRLKGDLTVDYGCEF